MTGAHPRPSFGLDGLLEEASAIGADVLQIADLPAFFAAVPERLDSLRRRAETLDLAIEVGTRGIRATDLEDALKRATLVGARTLRTVLDRGADQPDSLTAIALLRAAVPRLEQAGVTLAIENHDRLSVGRLRDIVVAVGSSRVGVCLDTVNSFAVPEEPGRVIAALAPHAVMVHAKDFRIRRADHGLGLVVEGTALGEGMLDVPALVAAVGGAGSRISIVIESWLAPDASPERLWRTESAWARSGVAVLRALIEPMPADPVHA
nr:sugar phosphate isomerase/epimerase family protein [Galbitalea sp. SE-J8]